MGAIKEICTCNTCGMLFDLDRALLGYTTCTTCGELEARRVRASWCVAQLYSKGNYQLVTNPDDLKHTNPKRTT